MQSQYVNTYFVIIDSLSNDTKLKDSTTNYNVITLTFDEAELGFLAGYCTVYEGYKNLGFIGNKDDLSSIHYGYGFLQGADYAAQVLQLSDVKVYYQSVEEAIDATSTAKDMYDSGVTLIYSPDSQFSDNVIKVADKYQKKLILSDTDLDNSKDCVVASTIKNVKTSVATTITNFYNQIDLNINTKSFDASNNGIILNFKSDDFKKFNENIYNEIYQRLANQNMKVISDTTVSIDELGLTNISVIK